MSLNDHIHQQSSKSGYRKKPSLPLKLLASFTPNSHEQIMEGGVKQKAKHIYFHYFYILSLSRNFKELQEKLSHKYTQIVH